MRDSTFDSRLFSEREVRFKTTIHSAGREHASAEEVPVSGMEPQDRAVGETATLHYGARLAAKLKAKIIVNDTEFDNPSEMSVDDRHLCHEALAVMFPPNIAVLVSEAKKTKPKKMLLVVVGVSVLAGAVCLWLRGFFG